MCILKGVFVANKKTLLQRKDVLDVAHEMLERFEAHLTAQRQFTVHEVISFFGCTCNLHPRLLLYGNHKSLS